jgi:hypothetical protein
MELSDPLQPVRLAITVHDATSSADRETSITGALRILTAIPFPARVVVELGADCTGTSCDIIIESVTDAAVREAGRFVIAALGAVLPWAAIAINTDPAASSRFATQSHAEYQLTLPPLEQLRDQFPAAFIHGVRQLGTSAAIRFDLCSSTSDAERTERSLGSIQAILTLACSPEELHVLVPLVALSLGSDLTRIQATEMQMAGDPSCWPVPLLDRMVEAIFLPGLGAQRTRTLSDTELVRLVEDAVPPHALFIGGSGQGKTTLLHHLIAGAITAGQPTLLICQHPDLVEMAADSFGSSNAPVVVYDFADPTSPPAWNLCEPDAGCPRPEWARRLADIVRAQLWPDAPDDWFGPVFTRMINAVLRALVEDPAGPWPLTKLPALIDPADETFRHAVLGRIADPELTRTLETEVVASIRRDPHANTALWFTGKFDPLLSDLQLRRIIGATTSEVDLRPLFKGTSVLACLPTTTFTESASRLLAALLLERVWTLARRVNAGCPQPVNIIVDEWHKSAGPALNGILSEGRKFGLRLRLANQHLAQLPAAVRDAALANTGLLATFRTGPVDARFLGDVYPTINARQLMTLPRHHIAYTTGEDEGIALTPPPLSVNQGNPLSRLKVHQSEEPLILAEHDDVSYADGPDVSTMKGSK